MRMYSDGLEATELRHYPSGLSRLAQYNNRLTPMDLNRRRPIIRDGTHAGRQDRMSYAHD